MVGGLVFFIIFILVIAAIIKDGLFIVKQQHAVIIERLGKFNRFVGAGFHVKIPFFERKATTVSLRTMKNGFSIDVKTEDNVTIGLDISAQYHVDYSLGNNPMESGIFKSYYMLQEPVEQMKDFITDALRSSIPTYSLDEVFAKKDDIAKDVNATVSEQMAAYGFTLVSTLITRISLPKEVEDSTEALAEAESMEKAGEGIANQRKAIAQGIKDSLETIKESGVTPQEANELFMFTQWADMMGRFAESDKGSTVVLPNDFKSTASMFEQMLAAGAANEESTK